MFQILLSQKVMPSQQTDDFSDGTSQSSNSFTSSLLGFSKIVEMASITSDLSLDTNVSIHVLL